MSDKPTMSVEEAVEYVDGCVGTSMSDKFREAWGTIKARAAEPTLAELREAADEYKTATDHAGWNVRMFCSAGGVLCFADAVAVQWATDAEAIPAIRAATAAERAKREPGNAKLMYGTEPAPSQQVTLEAVQERLRRLDKYNPQAEWNLCWWPDGLYSLESLFETNVNESLAGVSGRIDAELAKHEPTPAERFERLVTNLRQKSPQSTEDIRAIRAALSHPAQSEPQP